MWQSVLENGRPRSRTNDHMIWDVVAMKPMVHETDGARDGWCGDNRSHTRRAAERLDSGQIDFDKGKADDCLGLECSLRVT